MEENRVRELKDKLNEYSKKNGYYVFEKTSVFGRGSRADEEYVIIALKNIYNSRLVDAVVVTRDELKDNYEELLNSKRCSLSDILLPLPKKPLAESGTSVITEESQPQ